MNEASTCYIRQLQDQKGSAVIDTMTADDLATWGELCAWPSHAVMPGRATLHDRGLPRDRQRVRHAMATFAEAYADQNERDHAALLAAIKSGRIQAEQGV